jgi:hypothetical protein
MSIFSIGAAAAADAPLILAIDSACGAKRDPRFEVWAREILALGLSWLAEADGAAAGYALVSRRFFDRLFVTTNTSNAPMRALLAREGYLASGTIDNIDPGDPELVFVKFRPLASDGNPRPKGI